MKKKAHFNKNSPATIISLVIMIVVCVAVIFGSQAIYNAANVKYDEHIEIDFTIASVKDLSISSANASDYSVISAQEAYDENGELVAYIIDGTTVGYNQESPIEMETIISADGTIVYGIDVLQQDETEYLGVRIKTSEFKDQFTGRYLPVVSSTSTQKGSKIDLLSKSTISSEAVIDGVNNAQSFVTDNYTAEG
ncbi:MAG: FMN-binding protein [Clostridiales bacterium]|nr:FMN-binding protein [Clostridiales bacterium]